MQVAGDSSELLKNPAAQQEQLNSQTEGEVDGVRPRSAAAAANDAGRHTQQRQVRPQPPHRLLTVLFSN